MLQEEEESVSEVLKTLPLRGGLDLCDAKHPWSPASPGDLEPSWLRCLHSLSTSTDAGCPVEWEVAMLRAHGRTLAPESAAGLDLGTWQVRGVSTPASLVSTVLCCGICCSECASAGVGDHAQRAHA